MRLLEAGLLLTIEACSQVAGAETQKETADRPIAQITVVQADFPLNVAGGEKIQDHDGRPIVVRAGPTIGDTGGEPLAVFSNETSDFSYDNTAGGTMPNGGERPLQSTNSLPGTH